MKEIPRGKDTVLALVLAALLIGSVFVSAFTMARIAYAQEAGDSAATDTGAGSNSTSTESSNSTSTDTGSGDNSTSTTNDTSSDSSNSSNTPSSETSTADN